VGRSDVAGRTSRGLPEPVEGLDAIEKAIGRSGFTEVYREVLVDIARTLSSRQTIAMPPELVEK